MDADKVIKAWRRKRAAGRAALAALIAVLLAFAAFAAVNAAIRRPLVCLARERVTEIAWRALTEAAAQAAQDGGELLSVMQTGEESFIITADPAKLAALAARITADAQERLSDAGRVGVGVELGTLSGAALLSGRGPEIEVCFRPAGAVGYGVAPRLVSAGINQSLFTVDLTLRAEIVLLLAGRDERVEVEGTVPLCQTVVVGRVPQVYTNVANEDDMLNLIPTDLP
ncbi:MAG: sporulation protein YunB [Clostridia bacterium]|nr:sporulation protein YunB [Clostridia bacterium]